MEWFGMQSTRSKLARRMTSDSAHSESAVEIYIAANPIAAHRLRLELELHGIDARVVGDLLHGAAGELPLGMASAPAIWVSNRDAERAREIALAWDAREAARPSAGGAEDWNCPSCGAAIAGYLDECAACGELDRDPASESPEIDTTESDFTPLFENRRMAIVVVLLAIPVVMFLVWSLRRVEPLTPQVLYQRGLDRYAAGDYHGAIEDFEKCLFGNTYDAGPYNGIASAQFMLGQFEFARENYSRALRKDPTHSENYVWRAWCHYHLGDDRKAVADLKLALNAAPDDPNAQDLLAWLLATSPVDELHDGARALELAQRARGLFTDDNVAIRSTLAAAYAETGDYETAQRLISEVLAEATAADRPEFLRMQQAFALGQPYRDLLEFRVGTNAVGGSEGTSTGE